MDMIERVAAGIEKKIGELSSGDCSFNYIGPAGWLASEEIARTAIEACHEPTEEMLEAGREAFAETGDIRDAYVAMMCTAFSREFAF